MTIIIKYPAQNKLSNKEFFERKNEELTNLDWSKWGGWFDTDGCFELNSDRVALKLKDKEPVEIFSKIFETSLRYKEHKTHTPNGKNYIAKTYVAELRGQKAIWFTKNVSKYIFNKTMDVTNLLNKHNICYTPYKHQFTKGELINYIVSALQGDGTFYDRNKNSNFITFYSNNVNYLKFIQNELNKHDVVFGGPYKGADYYTQNGTKRNMFQITLKCKQKEKMINFYETIIPKIEMIRKKEKAMISLEYLKK